MLNNESEVRHALQVLRDHTMQRRGDSFDIGEESSTREPQIIEILQNPKQLANMLGLSEKQAENVRALITGAGAGMASKFLSQSFGAEVAGAFGGFLGGWISKRLLKE